MEIKRVLRLRASVWCLVLVVCTGNSVWDSNTGNSLVSATGTSHSRSRAKTGSTDNRDFRDNDFDRVSDDDTVNGRRRVNFNKDDGEVDYPLSGSKDNGHSGRIDPSSLKLSASNCPDAFGRRCLCGYNLNPEDQSKQMYVVQCENAGFSDNSVNVLKHLPQQTEKLVFVGNEIGTLPPNIFGTKDFPNLREINMSNNSIREIKGKAFHHVNNVERLILDNNHISTDSNQDHPRVFSNFYNLKELRLTNAFDKTDTWLLSELAQIFLHSNLTKLEKIHLEQNGIEIITNKTMFCDLPALMDIYLSQNKLSDVNLDISCFEHLRHVDVSYNLIRSIPKSSVLYNLLDQDTKSKHWITIELSQNPLNCDCELDAYLQWFNNWTKHDPDRVPHHENLRCKTGLPITNEGLHLGEVVHTECPILLASDYGSTALTTIVWILVVIIFLGMTTCVYTHRATVCRRVTPLLHTTQGVKYTSIEKNEEAEIAHV